MVNSEELIGATHYVMFKLSFALTDVVRELHYASLCHKGSGCIAVR